MPNGTSASTIRGSERGSVPSEQSGLASRPSATTQILDPQRIPLAAAADQKFEQLAGGGEGRPEKLHKKIRILRCNGFWQCFFQWLIDIQKAFATHPAGHPNAGDAKHVVFQDRIDQFIAIIRAGVTLEPVAEHVLISDRHRTR